MGQVISRQTRVLVIVAAAAVAASTFGVSSATAAKSSATAAKQTSKAVVQKRVIGNRSATSAPSRSGAAKFETQLASPPGRMSNTTERVAPAAPARDIIFECASCYLSGSVLYTADGRPRG